MRAFILGVIVLLAACTEPNPLIGTWQVKPGQPNFVFNLCKSFVFEKDLSRCGGIAEKVTYEIRDDEVIVHGETGLSSVYRIIDSNTISVEIPGAGEWKLNRVSY